jgi:hypothetical protein
MAWRYPSLLVPLGMSNLLHNRNEAKANIQMQKTEAKCIDYAHNSARF